jgi:hypothetical protein
MPAKRKESVDLAAPAALAVKGPRIPTAATTRTQNLKMRLLLNLSSQPKFLL